jgi:uncharacterized protein YecE (DUF72 family)
VAEQAVTSVHLGTSSWTFDGWRGVFYPERLPRDQHLAHYARHFDTVEVNTSFYAQPRPATLIDWVESVPAGFTFCLKFPRAISHEKRLVEAEAETRAFLSALRSLGPAAGPSFLQLPPDLGRQNSGPALARYLDWLAGQADGLRLAVEVRSPDLMTEAFLQFLGERSLAIVLVDRQGTPDLFDAWRCLAEEGRVPLFVVVRWIGDDRTGPSGDRDLTAPREADLARWAERIVALHGCGVDLFGYMHNPYEGHAPASVRRLQARLAGRIPLPNWPPSPPVAEQHGQLALFQ